MSEPRWSTRQLLACGVVAGPLYLVVGFSQALTRAGFDLRRHAFSHLSLGDFGWIQIANFVASGLLVVAAAAGLRRVLHPGRGGTWGPLLVAVYGLGLVASGVFVADPAAGFPPGAAGATAGGLSTSGLLHFVGGAVAFYALIAACFVLARRFAADGARGWAIFSVLTGAVFFAGFAGIASGAGAVWIHLAFTATVVLAWSWLSATSLWLMRSAAAARPRG